MYDRENWLKSVQSITYSPGGGTMYPAFSFEYDALGRMIRMGRRYDAASNGQSESVNLYNDGPNIIAEHDSSTGALKRRHVHGSTYVDERAVLLEGDGAAGTLDSYYYLLQELYTVTGLIKKNGTLAEAYVYDTYGKVTQWAYRNFDFDRDGNQTSAEYSYVKGIRHANSPALDPMADGDMDGDVDSTDLAMVSVTTLTGPLTLYTSGIGNRYYFTGAWLTLYEDQTISGINPNRQIQYNRARHYDPEVGRWMQRDPLSQVGFLCIFSRLGRPRLASIGQVRPSQFDPTRLFEYVYSNPGQFLDPTGLLGSECEYCGPDVTAFVQRLIAKTYTWAAAQGGFTRFQAWQWMYRWGGSMDWTNATGLKTPNCPQHPKCKNTYWLCGECVHDHWIGNFMYGLFARLLGFSDFVANWAADQAQGQNGGYDDPPWDKAGYEIARNLWTKLNLGNTLTINLCAELKKDATLWAEANDPRDIGIVYETGGHEGVSGILNEFPPPHAKKSEYKDCKACPESLGFIAVPGGGFGGLSFPDINEDPYRR